MERPAVSSTSLTRLIVLLTAVLLAAFVFTLHAMGRIPVCSCGPGLWTWSAWSSETSQHVGDPYSFSHVLHGIIFFWILWLLARRLSTAWKFFIAVVAEVGWEILENSPIIINRYRAATASLDYTGDSILNALGDVAFCMVGFWLAWKLPWKWTAVLVLLIELIMLALIRDNLTLNVLMLLSPIPAIKSWQMAH